LGAWALQAEADPAQLRAGKSEAGIGLQCRGRTLCGCAQLERIGTDRGRIIQQPLQQGLARCSGHVCRPAHAQIAGGLRLGQRRARTHRAAVHLRRTERDFIETPAQPLQQPLRAVGGCGRHAQHRRKHQGRAHQPAVHVQP